MIEFDRWKSLTTTILAFRRIGRIAGRCRSKKIGGMLAGALMLLFADVARGNVDYSNQPIGIKDRCRLG